MIAVTTFTKWFLLNAVMITAAFLAEQREWLSVAIKNDVSYISIVIMSLYVIVSVYVGRLCYLADRATKGRDRDDIIKRMDIRSKKTS